MKKTIKTIFLYVCKVGFNKKEKICGLPIIGIDLKSVAMDGQPLSDRLTESEKRLQVQNCSFKKKFIGFFLKN